MVQKLFRGRKKMFLVSGNGTHTHRTSGSCYSEVGILDKGSVFMLVIHRVYRSISRI